MSYEQQVWNAWIAGVFLLIVSVTYFVLSHRAEDHGPTLLARGIAYIVMLRENGRDRRGADMGSVYIPVSSMPYHADGMDDDAPDIDAENTDMPRVSRNITDSEMVVLLAAQKGANGKHRYSANQIHTLVGGDRNAVLARVKELRTGTPPALFRQPDGSTAPASRPVTGQRRHA